MVTEKPLYKKHQGHENAAVVNQKAQVVRCLRI